jgi:hypothetical protein
VDGVTTAHSPATIARLQKHFGSTLLELGPPMQERLLVESLRRLGIGSVRLLDHHIKILMHNFHLDRASAAIKLAARFLV